jgi:hypothetical protein
VEVVLVPDEPELPAEVALGVVVVGAVEGAVVTVGVVAVEAADEVPEAVTA